MSQFPGRRLSIISYSFKYILSTKHERRLVPTETFQTRPAKSLGGDEPLAKFLGATEDSLVAETEILGGTEHFAKSLGDTKDFPDLQGTPTESLDGNEFLATNRISTSLGKFKLDSRETSVSPNKSKPTTKALKLQAAYITFDFLGDSEKLKSVPRALVPIPPSMTYQKMSELVDLVHDWEFGETLVVNGCFIPLQYWQALYKDYFPTIWVPIKANWGNWRVRDPAF